MMALNITHQVGSLMGTPVPEGGSSTPTSESSGSANMNGSTVWNKSPMPDIRCRIKKTNGVDGDVMLSPPVSPCRSPVLGSQIFQPDLAVACQALVSADGMTATEEEDAVKKEHFGASDVKKAERDGVPVYVMLPLDSVKPGGGGVNRKKAMNASMMAFRSAGVEGVMVDVWWGIVEKERPGEYDWSGYLELMEMAKTHGLKVQAVMSFHQCGGNVGDSVTIPLPRWVVEEIDHDNDLAYTDQWGRRNYEYISLGCDTLPVLKGRTPVECYADFMRSFRERFRDFLGSTIIEVQVGMGPAGELRYPSYPEQNGTWKFPGIGAFQCFDKYMLSCLRAAAEAEGKPEWGHSGPTDAGGYNNWPEDTNFFRHDGGWCSPYGEFFLTWYSGMLLDHGDRILSATTSIFREDFSKGVKISVKIAGIHWHYGTRSHPAELTAGYYNTRKRDGYLPIAQMLGRHGAIFNFTCLEMRNFEQPGEAQCMPEGLVRQVGLATTEAGVELAGENALPRYDEAAFDQIVRTSAKGGNDGDLGMMCGFTYLRMSPSLFHPDNWRKFVAFVRRMSEGKGGRSGRKCLEEVEREAAPLVQETVIAVTSD